MTNRTNSQLRKAIEDRIARAQTGCWLWTGYIGRHGYGILGGKPNIRAHRASWMAYHGAIPEGLIVCHTCDVRHCVNPDHLFLGTDNDNAQDKLSKGRQARGSGIKTSLLTEEFIAEIRASLAPTKVLAEKFGVSPRTISDARNGTWWKHVIQPRINSPLGMS